MEGIGTQHAGSGMMDDGMDGAYAASAIASAVAVIMCTSRLVSVGVMDVTIVMSLAAIVMMTTRSMHVRPSPHGHYAMQAISRCCAYCLYDLLWAGGSMLFVIGAGDTREVALTAMSLCAALLASVTALVTRSRHASRAAGETLD